MEEMIFRRLVTKNIVYLIGSMYGIFAYNYHANQTNVGKYTIRGCHGLRNLNTNIYKWSRHGRISCITVVGRTACNNDWQIHETWTLYTKEHPVFGSIRSNSTNQKNCQCHPQPVDQEWTNIMRPLVKVQLFAILRSSGIHWFTEN